MGELLILQPEERYSPHHHLLPPGSGLYSLAGDHRRTLLAAAQSLFLNSPHPLEILSDRAAYGFEGAIYRDHDVHAYVRSIRAVIRRDLESLRKARSERRPRRRTWWPLVALRGIDGGLQLSVSVVVEGGRESLRRLGQLVISRHLNVLLVFLLPAKILFMGGST